MGRWSRNRRRCWPTRSALLSWSCSIPWPAERLAFVLHDVFELPFEDIAPLVGRSSEAARQLASRARRRIKGAEIVAPDPDLRRQREVVDVFFQAAREGDYEALVALLH